MLCVILDLILYQDNKENPFLGNQTMKGKGASVLSTCLNRPHHHHQSFHCYEDGCHIINIAGLTQID